MGSPWTLETVEKTNRKSPFRHMDTMIVHIRRSVYGGVLHYSGEPQALVLMAQSPERRTTIASEADNFKG